MKLGPHLHRIGNDIVAAYLVETEEGVTVIDAGLAGHWPELLARADRHGPLARRHPGRQSSPTATPTTSASPSGSGATTAYRSMCTRRTPPAPAARSSPRRPTGPIKVGADGQLPEVRGPQGWAAHDVPQRGGHRATTVRCSTCPVLRAIIGHARPLAGQHRHPRADRRRIFVGDGLTTRHVLTGRRARSRRRSPTTRTRRSPRWPASRTCGRPGSSPATAPPGTRVPSRRCAGSRLPPRPGDGGRQSWPTSVIADDGGARPRRRRPGRPRR